VNLFRGGLVFKAHRLLYHSILGLRVIKKKRKFQNILISPTPDHTLCFQLLELELVMVSRVAK